jgi:hypothetical protein
MNNVLRFNNCDYITKSTATRILGYANHNSIDHIIKKMEIRVFQMGTTKRKLIPLNEIKKHPRFPAKFFT